MKSAAGGGAPRVYGSRTPPSSEELSRLPGVPQFRTLSWTLKVGYNERTIVENTFNLSQCVPGMDPSADLIKSNAESCSISLKSQNVNELQSHVLSPDRGLFAPASIPSAAHRRTHLIHPALTDHYRISPLREEGGIRLGNKHPCKVKLRTPASRVGVGELRPQAGPRGWGRVRRDHVVSELRPGSLRLRGCPILPQTSLRTRQPS